MGTETSIPAAIIGYVLFSMFMQCIGTMNRMLGTPPDTKVLEWAKRNEDWLIPMKAFDIVFWFALFAYFIWERFQ